MNEPKKDIKTMLDEKIDEKAKEVLLNFQELKGVETLIQDNKAIFTYKEKSYRVRMPNQEEVNLINDAREIKLIEYIKDAKYMSEDYWRKIWKEKGVDLDLIDAELEEIQDKMQDLLFRLATANLPADIKKLTDLIESKKAKVNELIFKKTDKLQYAIEQRIRDYANFYTCYLLFEEKKEDVWKQVFDKYEDFDKCNDSSLIGKALESTMRLMYSNNEAI